MISGKSNARCYNAVSSNALLKHLASKVASFGSHTEINLSQAGKDLGNRLLGNGELCGIIQKTKKHGNHNNRKHRPPGADGKDRPYPRLHPSIRNDAGREETGEAAHLRTSDGTPPNQQANLATPAERQGNWLLFRAWQMPLPTFGSGKTDGGQSYH